MGHGGIGSLFLVLGSWFLVPGSWFLVLGSPAGRQVPSGFADKQKSVLMKILPAF
jgi:hypothetical protein